MNYRKTTWINDITPLDAEHLNNIENGIENVSNNKQDRLTEANAGENISITEEDGIVKINSTASGISKQYISLKRLASYLYEITFDTIPDEASTDFPFINAHCTSFVKDGKLYRNLDWNYSNLAEFKVNIKGITGMAFLPGLDDGMLKNNDRALGQLPYHLVDGINDSGIMVSTHVLFNDWQYTGSGSKNQSCAKLVYKLLANVKAPLNTASDILVPEITNILNNLKIPTVFTNQELLPQYLITDGNKTFALLPPTTSSGTYSCVDITTLPKLTNFRWVNKATMEYNDALLQNRPTGVERWNLIEDDASLEDLRFTLAYESDTRLSEFIGINETTKNSSEEILEAIYEQAHTMYQQRTRDGSLWQTMHSVVYGPKGMESLKVQENYDKDYCASGGGSRSSTISSITITPSQVVTAGVYLSTAPYLTLSTTQEQQSILENENTGIVKIDLSQIQAALQLPVAIVWIKKNSINVQGGKTLIQYSFDFSGFEYANALSNPPFIWQMEIGTGGALYESTTSKYLFISFRNFNPTVAFTRIGDLETTVENLGTTINSLNTDVGNIKTLIPTQATSSNQLADKNFVNSTVGTNTSNYISNNGQPFTSVAQLEAYTGTVTNNDYAFVTGTDESGNTFFDRYKATVSSLSTTWAKEYRLNNSSFTASQWAAINSGITSTSLDNVAKTNVANTFTQPQTFETAIVKKGNYGIKFEVDEYNSKKVSVMDDGATWNASFYISAFYLDTYTIRPLVNNDFDLGTASRLYKDLYLGGTANIGANVHLNSGGTSTNKLNIYNNGNYFSISLGSSTIADYGTSGVTYYVGITPSDDNSKDLGTSAKRWKNLYLSGNEYLSSGSIFYCNNASALTFWADGNIISDFNFKLQSGKTFTIGSTSLTEAQLQSIVYSSDLDNYIKKTDYASTSEAGIIRAGANYGTQVSGQFLQGRTRTYEQYKTDSGTLFVCKGTLENVLVGKNIRSTVVLTQAEFDALTEYDDNTDYEVI